jgi:phospholipid transport system substrate-binding protein
MMYKLFSLAMVAVFAAGLIASDVLAQDRTGEVRTMLEQRDRQIKTLLGTRTTFTQQQRDQLKSMINDVIDFEAMGRTALGTHWDGLTPAQRREFTNVFAEVVRLQSMSDLEIYRARVSYDRFNVQGNQAHVFTTTNLRNVQARVEYKMAFRDGQWRVNDIILDDVSTADGYARSFQSVIRRRGFEGLMTSLNRRLEQAQTAGS